MYIINLIFVKRYSVVIPAVLFFSFLFISCNKKKDNNTDTTVTEQVINISGCAQKGPFQNGSTVSVSDLNNNFISTGKSYNSQIIDNKGTFQFNNITISSGYICLQADGLYYNEVSCGLTSDQIVLNACHC